ncbi:hypothetical protein BJ508DRAFT_382022 [Ascobolus immersus RN42]|uniref:Uncharacterized protein n=1 Tax=Ascobolus immersus RN42 TaxID=1160509 RepID=A0A3N4HP88_ASCIM|nr:hypothetical protein BJ508DRAFT_382022 [Ascobolus immersus RN42]
MAHHGSKHVAGATKEEAPTLKSTIWPWEPINPPAKPPKLPPTGSANLARPKPRKPVQAPEGFFAISPTEQLQPTYKGPDFDVKDGIPHYKPDQFPISSGKTILNGKPFAASHFCAAMIQRTGGNKEWMKYFRYRCTEEERKLTSERRKAREPIQDLEWITIVARAFIPETDVAAREKALVANIPKIQDGSGRYVDAAQWEDLDECKAFMKMRPNDRRTKYTRHLDPDAPYAFFLLDRYEPTPPGYDGPAFEVVFPGFPVYAAGHPEAETAFAFYNAIMSQDALDNEELARNPQLRQVLAATMASFLAEQKREKEERERAERERMERARAEKQRAEDQKVEEQRVRELRNKNQSLPQACGALVTSLIDAQNIVTASDRRKEIYELVLQTIKKLEDKVEEEKRERVQGEPSRKRARQDVEVLEYEATPSVLDLDPPNRHSMSRELGEPNLSDLQMLVPVGNNLEVLEGEKENVID